MIMTSVLVALALGPWVTAVMRPLGQRGRRAPGSAMETMPYQAVGLLALLTSAVLVIVLADVVSPSPSIRAHYPGLLVLYAQFGLWIAASLRTRGAGTGTRPPAPALSLRAFSLLGLAIVSVLTLVVWRRTNGIESVLAMLFGLWAAISVPMLVVLVVAAFAPERASEAIERVRGSGSIGQIATAWVSWVRPG